MPKVEEVEEKVAVGSSKASAAASIDEKRPARPATAHHRHRSMAIPSSVNVSQFAELFAARRRQVEAVKLKASDLPDKNEQVKSELQEPFTVVLDVAVEEDKTR